MIPSLVMDSNLIEPDSEKILYCVSICRSGESSLINSKEMLGMFAYIIKNNKYDEYTLELSGLAYVIKKLYDIDTYKIIRNRG